jgi:hypothetical protein
LYCFLNSSFTRSSTFVLNSFTISSVISSAKEKEEEDAMSKEQARAMIKMLADLNVKTEAVDENLFI